MRKHQFGGKQERKKIIFFLILLSFFSTGASFFSYAQGGAGLLAWPAYSILTFFPSARKITKLYLAGDLADHYLSSKIFKKLIVEVDYLQSYRPEEKDFKNLLAFLGHYLDKPEGMELVFSDEIPLEKDFYTLQDVIALQKKYQTFKEKNGTTVLYFLILNLYEKQTYQGFGFDGSSIVILSQRTKAFIDALTSSPFIASVIRQRNLRHEVGHLLGLVNAGFWKSQKPEREIGKRYFGIHETFFTKAASGEHAHHSKNEQSLMGAVNYPFSDRETELFLGKEITEKMKQDRLDEEEEKRVLIFLSQKGYPLEFDQDDINDLEAIRGYQYSPL